MAVNLSMLAGAGAQFFDNSGVILSGGLIYTYAAGTTTPQAAYTTSAGNTAHTNPIVLDSAGRVASGGEIWLTDAVAYKFVLKTSTAITIGTYDNVTGNASGVANGIYATFALPSGSSLIGYLPAGTNATATTVQAKLRQIISLDDFIPAGTNTATTNCASYIQLAVNAAAGKQLTAVGTYLINSTINLASDSVYNFNGATFIPGGTTIENLFSGTSLNNVFVYGGLYKGVPSTSPVINSHPTGTYYAGTAFNFTACSNINISFVQIQRLFSGINFNNTSYSVASNNFLSDCAGGIQAVSDTAFVGSANIIGLNFTDNQIRHSGDDALTWLIRNTGVIISSSIVNNYISKDPGVNLTVGVSKAIAVYGTSSTNTLNVSQCVISNNTGYYMGAEFIRIQGMSRSTVSNNTVNTYAVSGSAIAYQFGYDGSLANAGLGVQGCIFEANIGTGAVTASSVFGLEQAVRCTFVNNFGNCNIAGRGTLATINASECVIQGNLLENTGAFAIQLSASSLNNQILNNNVSIYATLPISDSGSNNLIKDNFGFVTSNQNTATVPNGGTTVLISHGLTQPSASRIYITATPTATWSGAVSYYVDTITTTTFNIRMGSAPSANVTFQWQAIVI